MTAYICKFIMIIFIISPIYLLLRRPWRQWDKRETALAIFILFTVALLALAFEGTYGTPASMIESMRRRVTSGDKINLIPFRTIGTFFRHFIPDVFLVNIVGNIVMFMPWGFGLVLLWEKNQSVGRVLFFCFLITALIETGQLFIDRSVDVDDLILNFAGGCAGAALCAGLKRRFPVLAEFAERNESEYHKKSRKQALIPVILFLVVVIAAGGCILYINDHEQIRVEQYVEDYPEIYQEEFRIIFGEDCEIGEKNTIFVEGYDCDCGSSSLGYQYDTWEVTYHDRRGEVFTQTIDNMHSLESLQLSWLGNHLAQYYEKKYLMDYFDEGTFEGLTEAESIKRTYCQVSIGFGGYSYTLDMQEEFERIAAGNQKYYEQLSAAFGNRDTMLRLSEIDYEAIYDHYPMTTVFHLSINDPELSGEEKADYEKAVQDRVFEMIKAIQKETDDTCNLEVQVVSANGREDLYDGMRSWRYYILQGKQIEPEGEPNISYALAHAYAYEGIYW